MSRSLFNQTILRPIMASARTAWTLNNKMKSKRLIPEIKRKDRIDKTGKWIQTNWSGGEYFLKFTDRHQLKWLELCKQNGGK